jgi:hypothetical protein
VVFSPIRERDTPQRLREFRINEIGKRLAFGRFDERGVHTPCDGETLDPVQENRFPRSAQPQQNLRARRFAA